jgi:hypothetical protein
MNLNGILIINHINKNEMFYSKKNLSTVFLLFCIIQFGFTQFRLNFGLTEPQSRASLPVGLGKIDVPVRVKKIPAVSHLIKQNSNEYLLDDGWELAEGNKVIANQQCLFDKNYNSSNWYNAVVPGTVLTTLVKDGVYPDPYIGLNNLAIPDSLCREDWWYRIAFVNPQADSNKMAWLQFDGINYRADVWLNGKLLGSIKGAFIRGKFNITGLLKKTGKNILAVHIFPPPNPGIPHEQSAIAGAGPNGGQLCLDGPTFISSEGWDWVPGIRDRSIGLWQGVHLSFTGAVTLQDPQIITKLPLPDTTSANVIIKATLVNHSNTLQRCLVKGEIDSLKFSLPVMLMAGERKKICFSPENALVLNMHDPALWWPNGYGKQNLYWLNLTVSDNNLNVSDKKMVRFGIREFSYELMVETQDKRKLRISYRPTDFNTENTLFDNMHRVEVKGGIFIPTLRKGVDLNKLKILPDGTNPYLVIKVNGHRIFCKGGDWGMDDAMKRVDRKYLEPAFRLEKDANCDMVRNWTGESTEETFYDLADEYGMLVWNDFWMSTEGYNLNPLNDNLMLSNIADVVKRYRNHPSIAIWCPRNEGYAPTSMENKITKIIATEDGTRHYNGNSRLMNLRTSGGWSYVNNPADYFTHNNDGFTTEIGTFSIPVASTIRKFIKKPDQWPIDDVWNYHDLHTNINLNLKGYLNAVDSLYGKATGLNDFCKKVQLINYESHRAIFEARNSKLWKNTSGVLLWMTHPAWPSMIWQIYSYDYQTNGSYFGMKKACEPLHVQMNLSDKKIVAINTTLHSFPNISVILKVYQMNGKEIYTKHKNISLGVNEKAEAFVADFSSIKLPDIYLVRLFLEDKHHTILDRNSYWENNSVTKNFTAFNNIPKVSLHYKIIKTKKGNIQFEIENSTSYPAIGIKLNLIDANNQIVLPAYFSDGYFTLLPGEKRIMHVDFSPALTHVHIKPDGYNIDQN